MLYWYCVNEEGKLKRETHMQQHEMKRSILLLMIEVCTARHSSCSSVSIIRCRELQSNFIPLLCRLQVFHSIICLIFAAIIPFEWLKTRNDGNNHPHHESNFEYYFIINQSTFHIERSQYEINRPWNWVLWHLVWSSFAYCMSHHDDDIFPL